MVMSRSALSLSARPDVVNPPDDALAAAFALVGAGWGVFPARSKRPIRRDWQSPANGRARSGYAADVATVLAWWGPGGPYEGAEVGIALRDAGAFAIDLDDDDAAAGWAAMVAAGGGIAPTWTIYSTRGAKVIMRRDGSPVPLDANGSKVHRPEVAGADVVCGNVIAWAPGRRWEGSHAVVAPCPAWLYAPLSAIYTPAPRPAPAPAPTVPTTSPAMAWGRSWDGGVALARQCAKVASTAEGGRNETLLRAAAAVYGLAHLSPLIDRHAEADLLAAARASGLPDAEALAAIRSGAAWGRANPYTPAVRVDDPLGALETDDDAAAVRAEAAAMLAELRPDLDALAELHPRRRASVLRVVGTLLATVANTGRRVVVANLDAVAMASDVGRKTIAAAAADFAALGFTWQPGDAVERRAGCWTWGGRVNDRTTHGPRGGAGRTVGNTGVVVSLTPAASVATPVGAVPDELPLALRRPVLHLNDYENPDESVRRLVRRLAPRDPQAAAEAKAEAKATGVSEAAVRARMRAERGILAACGQWAAEALASVKASPAGATAEAVADALGVGIRTAQRTLAAMAARGILTSTAAPSTGRHRPRNVYSYAPAEGVLDAERAVGARVYARAVASAAARADRLAEARAEANTTGEPVAVVLSRMRAEDGARAAAERRAAEGGEIGLDADIGERLAAQTPVAAASVFVPIPAPWDPEHGVMMALPTVLDDAGRARIQRAADDRARGEWPKREAVQVRGLALHYYAACIRAVQDAAAADAPERVQLAATVSPAAAAPAMPQTTTRRYGRGSFIDLEREHAHAMAAAL